jgi:hypothetical protein
VRVNLYRHRMFASGLKLYYRLTMFYARLGTLLVQVFVLMKSSTLRYKIEDVDSRGMSCLSRPGELPRAANLFAHCH